MELKSDVGAMASAEAPLAEVREIHKRFGAVTALDGVSLSLRGGRVHGLLGENGAGKTTLMNVLYGLLRADSGQVLAGGRPLRMGSPRGAIEAGIGMVHQHFMLASDMSVLDNVLLGDRRSGRWIDRKEASARLNELAHSLGWTLNPSGRIRDLAVGQQQRVEIIKALWRGARVLILDEPTAVLTPAEAKQLFAAVGRLREKGTATVFISHKLNEVKEICDDLTVLRRGRVVWEGLAAGVEASELARHMMGREILPVSLERTALGDVGDADRAVAALTEARSANATRVLALEEIDAQGLNNICLWVNGGEILGIAGVDGNGQQELSEVIVGLRAAKSGRVTLGDADSTALSFGARRDWGIAHIPNDRKREGLVGSMSIAQNIVLKRFDGPPFSRAGLLRGGEIRRTAQRLMEQFSIRGGSTDTPVSRLSGGNQQKVILARELSLTQPRLIVAMNPVRGLDVAATNFVYSQLLERRAAGAAILLISSELDELLALCDRIGVLYNGRLTATDFPRAGAGEIGKLMAGVGRDA